MPRPLPLLYRGEVPLPQGAMQQRAPSPAAPPQSVSAPQQQQTPPTQQSVGQTPPTQNFQQATPPQPLPPQSSAGQQPMPGSLPSLPSDYFSGKGGMPGQQPTQQQMIGSSPHGPGGGVNTFGAPPTSGGIGGPGGGGLGGANQQAATDPEKRKLIQQQLVLLLHAHKCQRREREHSMGGSEYQPCSLPHCQTMKKVLDHMTECQAGRQCTYAHCASSRQIISHWKNCRKADCSVCLPLRNTALPHNQVMRPPVPQGAVNPQFSQPPGGSPQMATSVQSQRPLGPGGAPPNHTIRPHDPMMMAPAGRPAGVDSVFDPGSLGDMAGIDMTSQSRVPFPVSIPTIPNQQTQAWHQSVQPELRQHLVRKLVETIFPIQNPHALQDQRVSSLIQYAMKVEKAMFEMATSREAYYQLLAEKIYRIRKELEERKKMRMEMEKLRRPMGEGMAGMDGHIPNGGDGLGPGFFGSNQRHQMAPSPYSQSPFHPGHTMSPGAPSSIPDGNPSSVPSVDFLTDDKKEGILATGSKPFSPASLQTSLLPDLDNVKSEVKSEMKSPASIRPPWSRPEAPPTSQPATPSSEQKPILSVPRAPTPREPISSVKSRTGGENPPDSVPPSLPLSVPPATPSKMDTGYVPSSGKQKVVPDPSLKKAFSRDELLEALLPVLDLVYKQEPEACPFWEPVDPTRLGIPDYFDIIKNPMDLRTIRNKLEEGHYSNPWEFCSDMRLMFDNAWIYNKKTSRVYKYCTRLVEVFDEGINSAMVQLGYCCGGRHTFHPQVLYCYGKSLCTIARDSVYYSYQNRYIYCQKCFSEFPGDMVAVGDDPMSTSEIAKSVFKEKKNDHVDYEPMIRCIHCGRQFHSICVLHHAAIWSEGYQCDSCLRLKGTSRRENKFCARREYLS
ncbi:Protein cbp-1 [Geodia barretti]|uniref:histone acetyltransferase n=1 Tax=Geodia barretti TaxID=519541 RepID=A0AA35WGF4_GEOBA|nr:Protein cbp-1 [Geodia barretti]